MKRFSIAVVASLMAASASAQTVNYYKFTPSVLPANSTQPFLMEVEFTGQTPTRVSVDYQPSSPSSVIELKDDGTNGDRRSGDGIWSSLIPSAPIVAARQADDVQRVFFGFLNVLNGSTNVLRGNMFIGVYTADLGTPGITRLSQFVQATSRVVNIQDPAFFVSRDISHVTKEFYRWFGDDYDILNLIYEPPRFANRTHSVVRNDVEGIGLAPSNNSLLFGSAGRLLGISQFPIGSLFDGAETGHIHELGHQWVNFLNFQPLSSGIPHWPLSSMAGGIMGFSIGGQGGQGGSFRCDVRDSGGIVTLFARPDAPPYSDFDLYLMGLLSAAETQSQIVFADQAAAQNLQCVGQTYNGAVTRLTVDDIIARYGARKPAAGSAPTRYRLATILVTRDDLATPEEMWLYTYFAGRGELRERVQTHSGFAKELGRPFYLATGGRATLDMSVEIGGTDFTLAPAPLLRTVGSGSSATFSISAMPQGASFDAPVKFSCGTLPAAASCSFSPPEVTPGTTGKDTVLTISTKSSDTAGIAAAMTLGAVCLGRRRRRWRICAAIAVAALCAVSCSGSMPGANPAGPVKTPDGTYQIAVTGTAGDKMRSTTVTVVVQ